jgi:hypothetical protein
LRKGHCSGGESQKRRIS